MHVTDVTNASRTLLFDIRTLKWSERMCKLLDVPVAMLPEVRGCAEIYGTTKNVPGVPELFAAWRRRLPAAAFHYDTTTPVQLTRTYVDYLFNNYPLGSLEMRPINISDPSQLLDARQDSLLKLFQTFPRRTFGRFFFY